MKEEDKQNMKEYKRHSKITKKLILHNRSCPKY